MLDIIHNTPTYDTLATLFIQLNTNACAIPTTLGGGQYGHLGLTLTTTDYKTHTTDDFVLPTHPGPLPLYDSTLKDAENKQTQLVYKQEMATFRLCTNIDGALKQQLLAAINHQYISTLTNPLTGFGRVTTLHLITHLRDTYGSIEPHQLIANHHKMLLPFDVNDPFESFISCIEETVAFATAGKDPYTTQTVLTTAFHAIQSNNSLPEACRDWHNSLPKTGRCSKPISQPHTNTII